MAHGRKKAGVHRGVYAGSFDPPTNGHLWAIAEGAALFDELVVAIGRNPKKQPMFDFEARVEMLEEAVAALKLTNVTVDFFDNEYLVHYCARNKIGFILRGMRNINDFEDEHTLRLLNENVAKSCALPEPQTIYLMPPRHLSEVSSSDVKRMVGFAGWERAVKNYLPEGVYKRLLAREANTPQPVPVSRPPLQFPKRPAAPPAKPGKPEEPAA